MFCAVFKIKNVFIFYDYYNFSKILVHINLTFHFNYTGSKTYQIGEIDFNYNPRTVTIAKREDEISSIFEEIRSESWLDVFICESLKIYKVCFQIAI
jgi:hypothetical protein